MRLIVLQWLEPLDKKRKGLLKFAIFNKLEKLLPENGVQERLVRLQKRFRRHLFHFDPIAFQ